MTRYGTTRRGLLGAVGGIGLAALGSGPGSASTHVEEVVAFDPAVGELPENIAVDKRGTVYLSLPPRAEIRAIAPDRSQSAVATFEVGSGLGVVGVEVEPNGTLYATLLSDDSPGSDAHGVWRIGRKGTPALYEALDPAEAPFPNDVALYDDGLLVTDSLEGKVLRVTEGEHEVWLDDQLLDGDGSLGLGFPVGSNGLAVAKDGSVFVANTELGRIVRVPADRHGAAGTPETFAEDAALVGADGITLDVAGNLYVAANVRNAVVRVAPDGSTETLATVGDGLDFPADVAFGTARGEQKDLYVANFAFVSPNTPPEPSLATLHVGVPGLPIHR